MGGAGGADGMPEAWRCENETKEICRNLLRRGQKRSQSPILYMNIRSYHCLISFNRKEKASATPTQVKIYKIVD